MTASPLEACGQPRGPLWWRPRVTPPWSLPFALSPGGSWSAHNLFPSNPAAASVPSEAPRWKLPRREHHKHPEEGGVWGEVLWVSRSERRSSQASLSWKCWEQVPPGGALAQGQKPSPALLQMTGLQQSGSPALGFPRGLAQEV